MAIHKNVNNFCVLNIARLVTAAEFNFMRTRRKRKGLRISRELPGAGRIYAELRERHPRRGAVHNRVVRVQSQA